MNRQENSVTRAMHSKLTRQMTTRPPDISRPLLEWLEANFPPRCCETGEDLGQHLHYAGKVNLVQFLRASFSETSDDIAMSSLHDDNSIDAMIDRQFYGTD